MPPPSVESWLLPAVLLAGVGVAIALFRQARRLVAVATALADSTARTGEQLDAIRQEIGRIAAALERAPGERGEAVAAEGPAPAGAALAREIREAMAAGLWSEAGKLLESLASEAPGHPEADALAQALDRGRREAVGDLRARLDASRAANDPEAVLDYRALIGPLISDEARRELDTELVRWLLALLMRRMRTGTVRADVAALAARAAETFPATPEGASLRASLPTLRRSAGLCPRCAKPYAGVEAACPECLASAGVPAGGPTILTLHEDGADEDEPLQPARPEDDPFLREAGRE